jgi:hypothetical protein
MYTAFMDATLPAVPQNLLKSDRERAGLHGPVKTCIEDYQGRFSVTSEYTIDGRFLSRRSASADSPTWQSTHVYDAEGRVSKVVSGKLGEPELESIYTYDESGRIISITNVPEKGCRVDFQYDSQDRKQATQTFAPETLERLKSGVSVEGSFWSAAVRCGVGVPVGGKIITIYDDNQLPTESEILDGAGRVVRRFVRITDGEGRTIEEKWIWETPPANFLDQIPSEQRARLSPAEIQQEKEFFANLYGREDGMSYRYDAQGRVAATLLRSNVMEVRTETSYNEYGDEARVEHKVDVNPIRLSELRSRLESSGFGSPEENIESRKGASFPRVAVQSYAYQYDDYGNWTPKSVTTSYSPGESAITCTRRLCYH